MLFNRLFMICVLLLLLLLLSPEAVVSSGRVEKSPHEQEIKFFAKVALAALIWNGWRWLS